MDLRRVRGVCAEVVRDLPADAGPSQIIESLCERMTNTLGQPVRHVLVSFPPETTVSGLWVATDTERFLLCERDTHPSHQLAIAAHEFWHVHAGHQVTDVSGVDAGRLLFPSLEQRAVARILAARTHCHDLVEQEAEMFATYFMAAVSQWLPASSSPEASLLEGRVQSVLGRGRRTSRGR